MKGITLFISVIIFLTLLGWIGLQIKPGQFPAYPAGASELKTIPLPDDLPVPVARFYHQVYGDRIPIIDSAVISGRATLRINGITFPGRFRFTHIAGQGYRHYLEATLFGFPIMSVNEHYLDGRGHLELPFGIFEGSQVDQGGNLGLWSESMWFPSILVTDPRVRWESVDEETAILIIPFGDEEQRFTVRFDADTGLLRLMEAMRYRDAEGGEKILWLCEAREWKVVNENHIPAVGATIWLDQGTPWAVFTVEEIVYNRDVDTYIELSGLNQ